MFHSSSKLTRFGDVKSIVCPVNFKQVFISHYLGRQIKTMIDADMEKLLRERNCRLNSFQNVHIVFVFLIMRLTLFVGIFTRLFCLAQSLSRRLSDRSAQSVSRIHCLFATTPNNCSIAQVFKSSPKIQRVYFARYLSTFKGTSCWLHNMPFSMIRHQTCVFHCYPVATTSYGRVWRFFLLFRSSCSKRLSRGVAQDKISSAGKHTLWQSLCITLSE